MSKIQSAQQCCSDLRRPINFRNESAFGSWNAVWSLVLSSNQTEGLGALLPNGRLAPQHSVQTEALGKYVTVQLPLLVDSTRELDVDRAFIAAAPLIGAGPGLTPSWDDLLIGYICGLRATATLEETDRLQFLDQFGKAIYQASSATTDVSRRYIERTIHGEGPPWIEDVLEAISLGDSELARRRTCRAMGVGTTSGTDMMLGAMVGSSVWQAGDQAFHVLAVLCCCGAPAPRPSSVESHVAY